MAEEAKEEQAEPKKKSPLMLIIIGVVALLLIVVIIIVVLVFSSSGSQAQAQRAAGGVAPGVEATLGPIMDMDQFIVNLLSNDGRRYLKVQMSLELSHKNAGAEVQNKMPMIRDTIIQHLSSKRFDEIATESGKVRLREELKNNLNRYLIDGQIKNVFFTTFVIQ
ncbi:MAG: flagellar basal body-associated FliL family protein [Campylobacterales bacterium]